jgi:putative methionine-R-sulfoxide reductase with GAF domain
MKSHASIGADILSSIEFPYPVIPIVRHHHENWNGTGYPVGLRGTAIPIGARILAVADCFDALTSDRPYRPKLPDVEAESILMSRRGSMYDPIVVDTFIRILSRIKPEIDTGTSQVEARPFSSSPSSLTNILPQAANSTRGKASSDRNSKMAATLDLAARCVSSVVPHAISVFYLHDSASHSLDPIFVRVNHVGSLFGPKERIHLGAGVSGWVAANLESIVNSESLLDFDESERKLALHLTWCLSTPVIGDGNLLGVWTLYSDGSNQFAEGHQTIVEGFAQLLGAALIPSNRDATTDVVPPFDMKVQGIRRIV